MSDLGECDHQDGNPAVWEFVEGGASLFLCVEHILPRIHTLTQQVEKAREGLSIIAKPDELFEASGGAWSKQVVERLQEVARFALDAMEEK